jgi:acyl-CoA reductase-like NAD-dependent aldehyde dehydrogenase
VVGVIVPWNFPMPIASWGFAPALAAGNTVLVKPAELTPLTALRLAVLARQAGIPEDVLQVLPGKGSMVGRRLVEHPDVAKIVFTGSTEVGRQIMAGCADRIKPVTLELGGKSANLVFADADLELAAATAPMATFDNAGQDCCARSRILVEASVYDRFMELFEVAVQQVVVGDPAREDTQMGPLISAAHRRRVAGFVNNGSQVAFRGSAPTGLGFWFPPTVLTPTRSDDPVLREEIFGPVVTVQPFEDPGRRSRAAGQPGGGLGQPVGELAFLGAVLDAVRWFQVLRPRPRARSGCSAGVHRDEECLYLHEGLGAASEPTTGRQGGGGDRRR